jgi:uncharacterized protein (DUF1778 family)
MEVVRHKEERISIRLDARQKSVIDAAAETLGISLSSFVLSNVLEAANRIVEHQHQIQLSEHAWKQFVSLISADTHPTPAATEAAARYKGQ